jgi:site-specific recombinase XerD
LTALPLLPLASWPEAERLAWTRAITPGLELLAEDGIALRLRQRTRRLYELAASLWLGFLRSAGELDPGEALAGRATPERLDAWVACMRTARRAESTIGQYIMSLHCFFRYADPGSDTSHILRPGGRSLVALFPASPKPFAMTDSAEVLRRVEAMHAHGMQSGGTVAGRLLLRDAALLGILMTFAPRISDLRCIRIGQELQQLHGGGWRLAFAAERTKGKRTLQYALDERCNGWVRAYLDLARPHLAVGEPTDMLWLQPTGMPLSKDQAPGIVRRFTRRELGQEHGPHIARKWLRSTAARRSPELAFDAAQVLGHSMDVSIRHYTEAGSLHSQRRHGQRLAQVRKELAALLQSADQA